jgi:predicted GIY-YIG superfamily endonuclease
MDTLPNVEGVYALKLRDNKYYVGYSTHLRSRVNLHREGKGAAWTRIHNFESIVELKVGGTKADETQLTLEYMKRHGWQNVRGGPYVEVNMPKPPPEFEEEMSCFVCRSTGHLVADCPENRRQQSEQPAKQEQRKPVPEPPFTTAFNALATAFLSTAFPSAAPSPRSAPRMSVYQSRTTDRCYRCGRSGHYSNNCWARKDVDGDWLD